MNFDPRKNKLYRVKWSMGQKILLGSSRYVPQVRWSCRATRHNGSIRAERRFLSIAGKRMVEMQGLS